MRRWLWVLLLWGFVCFMEIEPDYARLEWITRNLHIIDKKGEFVRLRPNNGQLMLHAEMQQQRARNLPIRIVLLKPRQIGWSTWTEAEAFHDVYHQPNFNAMAVSVDADSTDVIFGMTKRFHDSISRPLPTDNTNRKALIFSPPHRSAFYAQTAGKVGVGRSFQARFLHCSEVAFWQDAGTQLGGLYQMVPKDDGTAVILESTANGMGGAFYDTYMEAKDRQRLHPSHFRGYRPVFFPWFEFAEYAIEPEGPLDLTSDERVLVKEFGLSDAQIYWRRLKIEELNGNEAVFRQEYPATDVEAFQTTGQPVLTVEILKFQQRHVRDDIRYGLFDPRTGDFMPHPGSTYGWQVLDGPGNEEHVIGGDTTEHRLTDEKDPHSQRDCDGVIVMGRKSAGKRVKAIWHGRGPQNVLGEQILGAAKHYNGAWAAIEIPQGMGALQVLVDARYPNIYSRRTKETQYDPEDTLELGYRTTTVTRHWLVNDLISALRADAILCQFQVIVDQMRTFIYDKTGKPIHMPGKHDDLIFGLALALQADLHCPRNLSLEIPERTGDEPSSNRPEPSDYDLAVSGAHDDMDAEDDEDDDGWYETV